MTMAQVLVTPNDLQCLGRYLEMAASDALHDLMHRTSIDFPKDFSLASRMKGGHDMEEAVYFVCSVLGPLPSHFGKL